MRGSCRSASVDDVVTLKTAHNDADGACAAAASRWGIGPRWRAPSDDLPLAVIAAALVGRLTDEEDRCCGAEASDLTAWLASRRPLPASDAINAATDIALLDKLHLTGATTTNGYGKACHDRVEALQSRDKAAQEADDCWAQMQSWSEADEVPLTRLVDTQRTRAKLSVDGERKARFDTVLADLQRKMQNEAVASSYA